MFNYGNYGNYGMNGVLQNGIFGGLFGAWIGAFLLPFLIWGIFWKGWALWKAARAESKIWFVVLLIVNTVGILDILYIFVFSKSTKKTSRRK